MLGKHIGSVPSYHVGSTPSYHLGSVPSYHLRSVPFYCRLFAFLLSRPLAFLPSGLCAFLPSRRCAFLPGPTDFRGLWNFEPRRVIWVFTEESSRGMLRRNSSFCRRISVEFDIFHSNNFFS